MKYPTITTERLFLRQPEPSDCEIVVAYLQDPSIHEYTIGIPNPYTDDTYINWCNRLEGKFTDSHYVSWLIEWRGIVVGNIALVLHGMRHGRVEINYWIADPYRCNGIATEAIKSVTKFAHNQLEAHKVGAYVFNGNLASVKTMWNCEYDREAVLKDHFKKNGKFISVSYFAHYRQE